MRQPGSRPVDVLMPVYRGDDCWRRALEALVSARHLFDRAIISFDGPSRADLATGFLKEYALALRPVVLVTPHEMTSTEHFAWMLQQDAFEDCDDDHLVTVLAEDDLIRAEAMGRSLECLAETPGGIAFGRWAIWPDTHADDVGAQPLVRALEIHRSSKSRFAALRAFEGSGQRTSISGITTSISVLRSYERQMAGRKPGVKLLSGVRTEFFLATQPRVTALIVNPEPIVDIQLHSMQEGEVTPSRAWNEDEALYQFWLVVGKTSLGFSGRLVAALRFTKSVVRQPSVLRKMPDALKTFLGVPHGS